MDKNELIFSGTITWNKLQMVKNMPFGTLRVKVELPKFSFNMRGTDTNVINPVVWVGISVNKDKNGDFLKKDKQIIDAINKGTTPYVIVRGAKITNWKNNGGILQFNIEASSNNISLSSTPVPVINKCIIEGKVLEYLPSGKMLVETSYMNPKTKEWKARQVPVIHTVDFDPSLIGKKVLLFGSVCSTTPSGDNKLYITSEEIYKLE